MRNLVGLVAAAMVIPNVANADPRLVQSQTHSVPIYDEHGLNRNADVKVEVFKDEQRDRVTVAITTGGYNRPYNEKVDAVVRPEDIFTGIYNSEFYILHPKDVKVGESTQIAFITNSGIVNLLPYEQNPEKQKEFEVAQRIVDYALDRIPMGKDVVDRFTTYSAKEHKKELDAEFRSINASYTATQIPMYLSPNVTSLRNITTALVYEIPMDMGKMKGSQTMSIFMNVGFGSPAQNTTGRLDNLVVNFNFEDQGVANNNGVFGNLFNQDNNSGSGGNERGFGGGGSGGGAGGGGGGGGGPARGGS